MSTVVGDYINTTKTTSDFNFDLYQAVEQYWYTKAFKSKEAVD